jgi:hypothetical protein
MDYIKSMSIQRMVLIEYATLISYSGIGKRAAHRVLVGRASWCLREEARARHDFSTSADYGGLDHARV